MGGVMAVPSSYRDPAIIHEIDTAKQLHHIRSRPWKGAILHPNQDSDDGVPTRHGNRVGRRPEHLVTRSGVHDCHAKGHLSQPPSQLSNHAHALELVWEVFSRWDPKRVEHPEDVQLAARR